MRTDTYLCIIAILVIVTILTECLRDWWAARAFARREEEAQAWLEREARR